MSTLNCRWVESKPRRLFGHQAVTSLWAGLPPALQLCKRLSRHHDEQKIKQRGLICFIFKLAQPETTAAFASRVKRLRMLKTLSVLVGFTFAEGH